MGPKTTSYRIAQSLLSAPNLFLRLIMQIYRDLSSFHHPLFTLEETDYAKGHSLREMGLLLWSWFSACIGGSTSKTYVQFNDPWVLFDLYNRLRSLKSVGEDVEWQTVSSYSRVTRKPPYYLTSFKLTSICVDKLLAPSGSSGLPQLQNLSMSLQLWGGLSTCCENNLQLTVPYNALASDWICESSRVVLNPQKGFQAVSRYQPPIRLMRSRSTSMFYA